MDACLHNIWSWQILVISSHWTWTWSERGWLECWSCSFQSDRFFSASPHLFRWKSPRWVCTRSNEFFCVNFLLFRDARVANERKQRKNVLIDVMLLSGAVLHHSYAAWKSNRKYPFATWSVKIHHLKSNWNDFFCSSLDYCCLCYLFSSLRWILYAQIEKERAGEWQRWNRKPSTENRTSIRSLSE